MLPVDTAWGLTRICFQHINSLIAHSCDMMILWWVVLQILKLKNWIVMRCEGISCLWECYILASQPVLCRINFKGIHNFFFLIQLYVLISFQNVSHSDVFYFVNVLRMYLLWNFCEHAFIFWNVWIFLWRVQLFVYTYWCLVGYNQSYHLRHWLVFTYYFCWLPIGINHIFLI